MEIDNGDATSKKVSGMTCGGCCVTTLGAILAFIVFVFSIIANREQKIGDFNFILFVAQGMALGFMASMFVPTILMMLCSCGVAAMRRRKGKMKDQWAKGIGIYDETKRNNTGEGCCHCISFLSFINLCMAVSFLYCQDSTAAQVMADAESVWGFGPTGDAPHFLEKPWSKSGFLFGMGCDKEALNLVHWTETYKTIPANFTGEVPTEPADQIPASFAPEEYSHYGPELKIDYIASSKNLTGKNGIFYVHGGAWWTGSREELNYESMNDWLCQVMSGDEDYFFAAPDYRLTGNGADIYDIVDDLTDAMDWVLAKTGTGRIITSGESAGGHLSMLMGLKYAQENPGKVAGASEWCGNLRISGDSTKVLATNGGEAAYYWLCGAEWGENDECQTAHDPVTYIDEDSPPSLLMSGAGDTAVPPANTVNVASLLELSGVKVQHFLVPRSNHGCGNAAGGPCGQMGAYAMERFMKYAFAQ